MDHHEQGSKPVAGSALLEAVVGMASNLDLAEVLDRIVRSACELTGARYAALGVLEHAPLTDQLRPLAEFLSAGVPGDVQRLIGETPHGRGVLRLLIDDPRPLRLPEITAHPASVGFPPHHPLMHSFLGVPIWIRGQVFGNLYLTEKQGAVEFDDDDEDTLVGLAAAAGVAIENARLFEDARRRERWSSAAANVLPSATIDISAGPHLIADAARHAGSCSDVILALRIDSKHADGLITRTDEDAGARVNATAGPNAEKLLDHQLRQLPGFRDLAREGTAALLEKDLFHPADPERATAVIWLRVGVEQVGLLIMSRPRTVDWTEDELVAARAFADQVALALAHAQAEHNRYRMAVYSDRDRIARDLHDHVIQRIFAVGLGLQSIVRRLPDEGLVNRIRRYIDDLDATITDIRNTIFSLHHETQSGKRSLRGNLMAIVGEATDALGFEPQITLVGPIDSAIPTCLANDVLATTRESLSNVARHARASKVEVLVKVDVAARILTVQVDDNGIGISDAPRRGGGLNNMAARAQSAGGHASTVRRSDPGTSATWIVPLPI